MTLQNPAFIQNSVYSKGEKIIVFSSQYAFFRKYLQEKGTRVMLLSTALSETPNMHELLVNTTANCKEGDIVLFTSQSSESFKHHILRKYQTPLSQVIYFHHFFLHRVFPRVAPFTRSIYQNLRKGSSLVMHSAEILGIIAYHGYSIIDFSFEKDMLCIAAKCNGVMNNRRKISKGLIFSMLRVGKNGNALRVYKLRTMHVYAECLQEYVLSANGLDEDGKFKDDFRVARWGKILRKYWIDELPMLINLLKGEIKLIGVRPISSSFLRLYPEDVRALRLQTKPGFIPPSYAFGSKSLEEVIRLEKIYLEEYLRRPLATDLKYLWRIFGKFIFRKIRSR